jgi:zinc/manganese transport system permease protein
MADPLALLLDPLHYQFMARGLVMAALIGAAGGLVGTVLVLRRMALMADSFGHALLPGIGLAWLIAGPSTAGMLAGAGLAGLLTALVSGLASRLTRLSEDTAFGVFFVIFMAAGVGILSRTAAPVDLLHLLFGDILAVTRGDLMLSAGVFTATVLSLAVGWRWLALECFDRGFFRAAGGPSLPTHLAILTLTVLNLVSALQAVGIVLCLAVFILPAATAYLWCERFGAMLFLSAGLGVLGGVGGMYLGYHLSLPSGPAIAGTLGCLFLLSALLSPRHGLLGHLLRGHQHLDETGGRDCALPPPPATPSAQG